MSAPDGSDGPEPIPLDQGSDESPAMTVVTTVAEVTGRSPLEMEPLGEVIDPDALDRLLDSPDDRLSSVAVSFDYCGQQVTVAPDSIQVDPRGSAEK